MDYKTDNKDFVLDEINNFKQVTDEEEVAEQIKIALTATNNKYVFDKKAENSLYDVDVNSVTENELFGIITETLYSLKNVKVEKVEKQLSENNENLKLIIYLKINNENNVFEMNLTA